MVKKQCVRLHHQLIETDDVRMRDIGETAEFPLETRDVGRARPPQGLERDCFVAHAVVDRVDDAHSARTEPAKDGESLRAAKLGLDRIRPVRALDRRRRIVEREHVASDGQRRPREKTGRAFVRPDQTLDVLAQPRITRADVDQEWLARVGGAREGCPGRCR